MSNADTVKAIYEAFGRGDVPAILEKLDQNVEWETQIPVEGVPWLTPRHGRDAVAGFFQALAPLEFKSFNPHSILDGGGTVVALISLEFVANGKSYPFPLEAHVWQFNGEGKVARFDHITDTALMQRAANGR